MKKRRESSLVKKSSGETQISRGTANFLIGGIAACLLLAASSLFFSGGDEKDDGDENSGSEIHFGRSDFPSMERWIRARLTQPTGANQPHFLLAESLFNWSGEQVVRGAGGWLFSRSAFLQFTAPPPADLPAANAVRQVARYLAEQNILLIVLPTPDKLNFEFRQLGLDISLERRFLLTPTETAWLDALSIEEDLQLLQPAESFAHASRPFFLETDSGWQPETLGAVAQMVAARLVATGLFPRMNVFRDESPEVVTRRGNLALASSSMTEGETVNVWRLEPISLMTGSHEIVLVGDYLAAIFEEESAGWGVRAGLPSRIAAEISRPLKTFLSPDNSSATAMKDFLLQLRKNRPDFRDLKVVIWQISTAQLQDGAWETLASSQLHQ